MEASKPVYFHIRFFLHTQDICQSQRVPASGAATL